jgi:hypothetical protein
MYIVKLFVPLFAQDFVAEHLVAKHLAGKLGVETPEIVADGLINGWHYLVMTRIPGIPLQSVWDDLSPTNFQQIAAEVGEMIARLRTVPVSGLDAITVDWVAFLGERLAEVSAYPQTVPELSWDPKEEIGMFFASLSGAHQRGFPARFAPGRYHPGARFR